MLILLYNKVILFYTYVYIFFRFLSHINYYKILSIVFCPIQRTSLVAQTIKPTMQETWVRSLGQENPLEKKMAIHSCTLTWKIPWMEEPGRLQSMGSQRVRHDWLTSLYFSPIAVGPCVSIVLYGSVYRDIFGNMDGPREYQAKWSKTEKEKHRMIPLICGT